MRYIDIKLCVILVLYSEVPGTTSNVTDIGETSEDGTTTQVSSTCSYYKLL